MQYKQSAPLPQFKPGEKPKQPCATCIHQKKCWSVKTTGGNPVTAANVAINVLICRIKMGIDVNTSTKNLLGILKPGIVNIVSRMQQNSYGEKIDFLEAFTEAQSKAIEYLAYEYNIGDFLVATAYLFNPIKGYLPRWAQTYVNRAKRFNAHHRLHSELGKDSDDPSDEEESYVDKRQPSEDEVVINNSLTYEDNVTQDSFLHDSLQIINDGMTLNSNEYRVFKFCMTHANEQNSHRHVDGLHLQLAILMGVSRPRITRLYKRAKDKLIEAYERRLHEDKMRQLQ